MEKRKKFVIKIAVLTIAAVLSAVDTKIFINAGGLYPGGIASIALLVQRILSRYFGLHLSYAVLNVIASAIPIYIGFRYLGRKFTAYSCYNIVLASVLVDVVPDYAVTDDMLLISVFGGLLCAFSSVLCLWMDATAGGQDFISIAFSVTKGIDAWNLILTFNVMILLIAGYLFGWDKALYSIIFQYAFTQLVQLLYHKYQYQTLLVITSKPYEVSAAIYEVSRHGATILHGTGSYAKGEQNVVYSIISRGEVQQVMEAVLRIDADAFVNAIRTEKLKGYFYQKPLQ